MGWYKCGNRALPMAIKSPSWLTALDVLGAGAVDNWREPEVFALPDLSHGQRIHCRVREMRQQLRRRNDRVIECALSREAAQLIQRARLIFREIA